MPTKGDSIGVLHELSHLPQIRGQRLRSWSPCHWRLHREGRDRRLYSGLHQAALQGTARTFTHLLLFSLCSRALNIATHVRCICQDKWNRTIVKGISHTRNHCLKIKARVRAKGSRGHNWFHQRQMEWCRGRARVQSLWVLHLAGDFHGTFESGRPTANPHLMRCMLCIIAFHTVTAAALMTRGVCRTCAQEKKHHASVHRKRCMLTQNIDVEQRFANGTQGRLLCWHPCGESQAKRRKVLQASHPELSCRFVKESSLGKSGMMADIDHLDIVPRAETLNTVPGQPVMLQLGCVPAYALTVRSSAPLCDVRAA